MSRLCFDATSPLGHDLRSMARTKWRDRAWLQHSLQAFDESDARMRGTGLPPLDDVAFSARADAALPDTPLDSEADTSAWTAARGHGLRAEQPRLSGGEGGGQRQVRRSADRASDAEEVRQRASEARQRAEAQLREQMGAGWSQPQPVGRNEFGDEVFD